MRVAVLAVMVVVLTTACSAGPAATPIIIYVTPAPTSRGSTQTPAAAEVTPSSAVQTSRPTPTTRSLTPKPVVRQDIDLLDSGFSVADGYISYAVVGRNPNEATHVAYYVPLQITFYEGDVILKTEEEYFSFVLPGQTTATSGFDEISGRPTRMEVRKGTIDWETIDFTPGRLVFDNVQTKSERFGGWNTTGTALSEFQTRQENVRLTAVHLNAAGVIVGGDVTFLDFVDPGTKVAFEVNSLVDIKDITSSEMYFSL